MPEAFVFVLMSNTCPEVCVVSTVLYMIWKVFSMPVFSVSIDRPQVP